MNDHREAWPTAILTGGELDGTAVKVNFFFNYMSTRRIYKATKSGAAQHASEGQGVTEFNYVKTDEVDTEGRTIFVVAPSS